ncbi:hypothetical protein [Halomonas korlensis]|uniref:hypothetical protein n=1 Tax=Halomonas korlensis TaxID=463301 RepID=UPI0015874ED2
MSGIVLGTLFTTVSTYFSADSAYITGVFAALGHEGSGQTADLRTLHIQADAFGIILTLSSFRQATAQESQ